jgi:hypothetical protein
MSPSRDDTSKPASAENDSNKSTDTNSKKTNHLPPRTKFTGANPDLPVLLANPNAYHVEHFFNAMGIHVGSTFTFGTEISEGLETNTEFFLGPPELIAEDEDSEDADTKKAPPGTPQKISPKPEGTMSKRMREKYNDKILERHIFRMELLVTEKKQTYTIIWGNIEPTLQDTIKNRDDFTDIKKNRNPFQLTELIKKICHTQVDHTNIFQAIFEALKKLFTFYQRQGVDLHTHFKHFDAICTVLKSHNVTIAHMKPLVDKMMENKKVSFPENATDSEKKTIYMAARKEAQEQSLDAFFAVAFVLSCNRAIFSEFVKDLETDYEAGHDKWPKTPNEALQRMLHYQKRNKNKHINDNPKIDAAHFTMKGENKKADEQAKKPAEKEGTKTIFCFGCGEKGHTLHDCTDRDSWKPNIREEYEKQFGTKTIEATTHVAYSDSIENFIGDGCFF